MDTLDTPDTLDTSAPPMSVTVILPAALRARAQGQARIAVTATTLHEVLARLDEMFPGMRFNLCEETGELRPYVNIFLGRENIRYLQGLETPLAEGATLHILQSVAGG